MKDLLRSHLLQILIIFVVLLLFLGNAVGLFEISVKSVPTVTVRTVAAGRTLAYISSLISAPDFLLLCATGLCLAVLLPVLTPVKASLLAMLCAIPPVLINLFDVNRVTPIPMEYSLLTVLVMYSVNVLIAYFRENHSRQKIVEIFGQYVPPEIAGIINKDPGRVSLEGECRYLTVFFCDLQRRTYF